MSESLNFKLEIFEGPLDLLLSLISKNKVDIYDIPISLILDQYLENLEMMRKMDMDVAGEFITMASELMLIKSRMLLPKSPLEEDVDPRERLAQALIEYKRAKEAAVMLNENYLKYAGRIAKSMDEAPFQAIPEGMFEGFDYVTPNETEAEFFTGVPVKTRDDMEKAAAKLLDMGAKNAIITLGVQGSFWSNGTKSMIVPALKVEAVDTTGAGDAFNGGLSVAIAEGMDIELALKFASAVAGLSVTGRGSAPSMPKREAVNEMMLKGYGIKL